MSFFLKFSPNEKANVRVLWLTHGVSTSLELAVTVTKKWK
jgi:hypothetical protein